MPIEALAGMLIPFTGTSLGAACVFVMRDQLSDNVNRALSGFAAGVMVAASIWSLIQPAMDEAATMGMGRLAFLPAFVGVWLGTLFLLGLDKLIPHLHANENQAEGPHTNLQRTTLMVLAITLHNIPEGMAVGVVLADWMVGGNSSVSLSAAMALAVGIAIQNFPEGAIVAAPMRAAGSSKARAFAGGVLSGVAELAAAALTILAARFVIPFLPYLLGFAAGAMLYVVVEELVPEMSANGHSHTGVLAFTLGFTLMMALDVALA